MPLLGKKRFQRIKPPEDLHPDEKLFYCRITNEVFREYETFFDRVILCNSLVWTCSLTGKAGLTYQEAIESEKNARATLEKFPKHLRKPVLYLANLTSRSRLNDVCDDVFMYVKNRYFVGEKVEVALNGIKKNCEVTKVISPEKEPKSPEPVKRTPNKQDSKPKLFKNVNPDKIKYEVKQKDTGKTLVVKSQCISRPKGSYTRANNKLFLRHNTVSVDGVWKVKNSAAAKHGLHNFQFTNAFRGPLPKYALSPGKKKVSNTPEKAAKPEKVEKPEKEKEKPAKEEKKKKPTDTPNSSGKKVVQGKLAFKNQTEEAKLKAMEREQEEFEKQRLLLEQERQRRKEELKKRLEEEREKLRQQKLKERERKKEEKKKLAEYLSSWKKPRDDLECDDLKELPKPTPVECNIPVNCFGDAVMVLEFLNTFGDLINLKDSFPQGFTFEHLEKALLETDIQGYFNDLVQLLLTSIFQHQDVEADKSTDSADSNESALIMDHSMTADDAITLANAAFLWPQLYHGTSLQNMPLDSFSVTEVLRLHILSSGSNRDHSFGQSQNGVSEDPGLLFKVEETELLHKLASTNIFEMSCEERVKILTLLVHQLVLYESFRSRIEDNLLKAKPLKMELKQLKWAYSRHLKEESVNKMKKKQEEKLSKSLNGEVNGNDSAVAAQPVEDKSAEEEKENVDNLTPEQKQELEEKKKKEEAKRRMEFQRKERELKAQIEQLQSSYQVAPLGRDRAFRRFWVFRSLPGLFVEDDDSFVGPCLHKETPQMPPNTFVNRVDGTVNIKKYLQQMNESKNGSSDKENDILQDLAIIQSDIAMPLKPRKLSDLNTRDFKKSATGCDSRDVNECLQCSTDKVPELSANGPHYCPHSKVNLVFGMCTASIRTCPVHNLNAPRTKWSFYYREEDLDLLLSSLNARGFRESALKDVLVAEKESLCELMSKCQYNLLNKTLPAPPQPEVRKSQRHQNVRKSDFADMKPEDALELTFRDMILELEHRIHAGGLGSLKVKDRQQWRDAIEQRTYDKQCDKETWESKYSVSLVKQENPGEVEPVVRDMASALLQVSDGIEGKYLHPPLGESDHFKQLKEKYLKNMAAWEARQKANGENEKESGPCPVIPKSPLARWQESLVKCTSLSQLFVHLGTLERSVAWSRSVLKAHCRICRRRGDGENMLLCDGCNRGHHLYCLKPPLKEIPQGDWFCTSCKPPEKTLTPQKKRQRLESASEGESDDEDEDEDEEDEDESGDEGDDDDDEADDSDEYESETAIEVCESCGVGGTVICCDKCPKVYHPECIGIKRIPRGEWLCPKCQKKDEAVKRSQRHGLSGSYGTRAHTLVTESRKSSRESRRKIQIKASKRKQDDSSDSDFVPPTKKTRSSIESAPSTARRRSKSSESDVALDYKTCLDILDELMHHPSGWPFLAPVSKKDAPGYHQVIKRPMDFGTIRSKLNNMKYKSNEDFVRDLCLVFQNCELFNPRESPEFKAGRILNKEAKRLLTEHGLSSTFNSSKQQMHND